MRKIPLLAAALALAGVGFGAQAGLPGASNFEVCDSAGPVASMHGSVVSAAKSTDARIDEMLDLNAWLTAEASPKAFGSRGFSIELNRDEQFSLGMIDCADCEHLIPQERRYLVGLSRPVGHVVDFAGLQAKTLRHGGEFEHGVLSRASDGGLVWTASLQSPGAAGLRILLTGLDLPANAGLYVFNDRGEAFGPYLGRGNASGSGEVTTNMVSGDTVYLQLRVFGAAKSLADVSFTIAEIGHISDRFGLAAELNATGGLQAKVHCTSGTSNASCVENAECYGNGQFSHINNLRKAIASILYRSGGGYYICTGGLIDNAAGDPLFLTANHCLSKGNEANSLETYWNHTVPCGTRTCSGAWTVQGRATEVGASILATNRTGDFTLLRLSAALPSGAYRLGWTNAPVANSSNAQLHRISHPNGAPQAYSEHRVNTTAGTCGTLPRGTYIYSSDNLGATEGGSSGSPVVNSAGLIVGQLYGACGSNVNDVCDIGANRTVDGALAGYFAHVESFLTAGGSDPGDPGDPGTGYNLTGSGSKVQGRWRADLAWSGAGSSTVDVYRQGGKIATVTGTSYVDQTDFRGGGSLTYKVCDSGSTTACSSELTLNF
jgi:V8-like Glu-specific endopeptidase